MANVIGNNIEIHIFGESHQDTMGILIDNYPAGIKVDYALIKHDLSLRAPSNLSTTRKENDDFEIVSGILDGITTGATLTILLHNHDINSSSYKKGIVRPNHADYPAYIKYNSYNDYRGGGFFSGRLTALLVIAGSLFKQLLLKKDIFATTHINTFLFNHDRNFNNYKEDFNILENKNIPILDEAFEKLVIDNIETVRENKDSVGAILETAILNLPIGLGEPYFDSFESILSHYLFSIGGIKGIEFGLGFDFATKLGSDVVDNLRYVDGNIEIMNNNNGGINGGLTNSNPVIFRVVVKPTPTISKEISTINIETKENIYYKNEGRNDACIALRIAPVINAICYIVVYDFLLSLRKDV